MSSTVVEFDLKTAFNMFYYGDINDIINDILRSKHNNNNENERYDKLIENIREKAFEILDNRNIDVLDNDALFDIYYHLIKDSQLNYMIINKCFPIAKEIP